MSSILKALKKIEQDSPQTHPSSPKPIVSRQVLNSNTSMRWRRILHLFLMLLVIAVVTVILFSQRRLIIAKIRSIVSSDAPTAGQASNTSRTKVYRAKVSTATSKPAKKPPTVTRQPKTQTKKVGSGNRAKKFQASTRSSKRRIISGTSPSQTSSGMRSPDATLNSRVKKPLKKGLPPPVAAPAKRTTAPKDAGSTTPAVRSKQPAQTRPRQTYDRITDSKLKLQALAWSEDAVRRMAVINGRIVHEGESVDGYQVVKIRAEDVIVNAGGKSWRLEFGLRQ